MDRAPALNGLTRAAYEAVFPWHGPNRSRSGAFVQAVPVAKKAALA